MLSPLDPSSNARPGNSKARAIAIWFAICAIVAAFVGMQHLPDGAKAGKPRVIVQAAPAFHFTYVSRYALGIREWARFVAPDTKAFPPEQFIALLEKSTSGPADSVALVIITAELMGPERGAERQRRLLERALTPERKADLELLAHLREGRAVDSLALVGLVSRYGWFGQLLVPGASRENALSSARRVAAVVVGAVFATGILGLAGLAALILIGVLFRSGKLSWTPQAAPVGHDTAFLEAAALTLAMALLVMLLGHIWTPVAAWLGYPLLFVPLFWPRLRGVGRAEFCAAIGLHRGRGVLREAVAGLLGYLAAFPVLVAGLVLTLVILGGDPGRAMHPITEGLQRSGSRQLAVLFLFGVFVGPFFEEMLFRGVLQHHLRRRWGRIAAGTLASVIFAVLHPQGAAVAPMLALIGFALSLIREWRGSLAASFAAHAANNGAVFVFTLLIFR
jgi:membrane protease YdiL (CAAX protease family)